MTELAKERLAPAVYQWMEGCSVVVLLWMLASSNKLNASFNRRPLYTTLYNAVPNGGGGGGALIAHIYI